MARVGERMTMRRRRREGEEEEEMEEEEKERTHGKFPLPNILLLAVASTT
jgi:hypothetical protein